MQGFVNINEMLVPTRFISSLLLRQNRILIARNEITVVQAKNASGKAKKSEKEEPEIPRNLLQSSGAFQPTNGKIYDKKPFKLPLQKDKIYFWCLCGHSKGQPLCDGTHKNPYMNFKHRPVKFQVAETKEYWLCNCKQTSNRPFCDGTHKRQDIQEAIK